MKTLRPIQRDAMSGLRKLVAEGHSRVLLVAPTGFGKTVVIVEVCNGHLSLVNDGVVLVIAHRRELVRQTANELRDAGVDDVGILDADSSEIPKTKVIVASLMTLVARKARPRATCVVWDEAHHCPALSFRTVFEAYPDALHIGATATPQRGDGQPLGDMFTGMHVGAQVRQLTALGLLTKSEVLALAPANDNDGKLAMSPLEAYQRYTPGRAAVVFCSSVAHAEETAAAFNAAGIRAACIDGEMPTKERDAALAAFARAEIQVLTNCFVLTEGWNAPRADVCILARGCEHVSTYLQMVGRILRLFEGKTIATVLDLAGVVYTHGLPDEDRAWSLSGTASVRTEKITALQRCKECLAIFRPQRQCPRCGARHEVQERIPRVLTRAEKLIRVNELPPEVREERAVRGLAGRLRKSPKHAHKEWDELVRLAVWMRNRQRRSA